MPTINPFGSLPKPFTTLGQVTTANTARDGTGTIVTLHSGAAQGSVITRVDIKATGTTTSGAVVFFVHDGSNARYVGEVSVSAITPAAGTVKSFEGSWVPPQGSLAIPNTYSLRAATEKSETFNLVVTGTDYA